MKKNIDVKKIRFSTFQIFLLLCVLTVISYYIYSQFTSLFTYRENMKKVQQAPETESPTEQVKVDIFEIPEPLINDNFKVRMYYFSNKEGVKKISEREEDTDILYLILENGISDVKFNNLTFTIDPYQPINVKLEKPNLISVTFSKFEPTEDFIFDTITIMEGETNLYRLPFYSITEAMKTLPEGYIPTYN